MRQQAPWRQLQVMNPLVGTWRLLSGELRDGRGGLCGRFVHGVLHYTPAGLVSAQCGVDDGAAAAFAYYAYYGSYEVDPQRRTVVHTVLKSNVAAEEGNRVIRSYEIAGGRLILRFPGIASDPDRGATSEPSGFIILEREER